MASATPSCICWISTPWRLANANGKLRCAWAAPAAAPCVAPRGGSSMTARPAVSMASALSRFTAIGRGGIRQDGLGRLPFGQRKLLVFRQRRQLRPLELVHQDDGVGGQLALEVLDVA